MSQSNLPAFPGMQTFEKFDDQLGRYTEETPPSGGLSKREFFAARAMQGLLSDASRFPVATRERNAAAIAETALLCADALLTELEK